MAALSAMRRRAVGRRDFEDSALIRLGDRGGKRGFRAGTSHGVGRRARRLGFPRARASRAGANGAGGVRPLTRRGRRVWRREAAHGLGGWARVGSGRLRGRGARALAAWEFSAPFARAGKPRAPRGGAFGDEAKGRRGRGLEGSALIRLGDRRGKRGLRAGTSHRVGRRARRLGFPRARAPRTGANGAAA